MSTPESQQESLSSFESQPDREAPEETADTRRPAWLPDSGQARHCRNCGSHVSDDFARVFAGNDGVIHRCPSCANGTDIRQGAVSNPDYERRSDKAAFTPRRRHMEVRSSR